jgi:hypothetical protein
MEKEFRKEQHYTVSQKGVISYLCTHYCYNEENDSYECEIKKAVIEKGSDALSCDSYVLLGNAFDRFKNKFLPFTVIDTWSKS